MRLDTLQLRAMPEYTPEEFRICERKQYLGIWHHQIEDDREIFVVQCKREILFGYGHMFAQGFILEPSGQKKEPEEHRLWDYT
jgi:hypothetical protein